MTSPELLNEYKRREFLQLLSAGTLLTLPVRVNGQTHVVRFRAESDAGYTLFTGKVELGQGARTLLSQAAAEELRLPLEKIRIVMADTEVVPDDGGTWASLTTPTTVPAIRQAGAEVRGGSLTQPKDWRVLGQSSPTRHGRDIVTGAHRYNADLKIDGMLHGRVARSTALRTRISAVDTRAAEAMPGVKVVRDGDLVGVVAASIQEAEAALAAVRIDWKEEPLPSMEKLRVTFKGQAVAPVENMQTRYPPLIRQGDVEKALAAARNPRRSSYWTPYIAHVPLETRAAIAQWEGDRVTIHCGKQAPFLVRAEVAKAVGIPETNVRLIVSDPGGAFGSKQRADVEIEAARLARNAGKPVRVHWTREEEFQWAYARPAALVEIESATDSQGRLVAWRHRNYNSGAPGLRPPYAIEHQSNEFWRCDSPVRQGSYRALAATANNFARESHVDECAAALKRDPLEFRLANLSDARMKEALERGAERFGWGKRPKSCGLACNIEKEGRLALFTEIELARGSVRVRRIVIAADFGAALNPGNLKNQIQGAVIQGMGGALWEQIRFDSRSQLTKSLSQYRLPRMSDVPEFDVLLIDRRDVEPAGAGEAPITMIAPALANALYAATGERRRDLPLNR